MNDDIRNYIKDGLRAGEFKPKPRRHFGVLKLSLSALVLVMFIVLFQKGLPQQSPVANHLILNPLPDKTEMSNLFFDQGGYESLDAAAFKKLFPMFPGVSLDFRIMTVDYSINNIIPTVILERWSETTFISFYLSPEHYDSIVELDYVIDELSCAPSEECTALKRSSVAGIPMVLYGEDLVSYAFMEYQGVYVSIHSNLDLVSFEHLILELVGN